MAAYGVATPEPYLVATGAGDVVIDGEVVSAGIPEDTTLVVDGEAVERRPSSAGNGRRLTAVRANGSPLEYRTDHLGGLFTGTSSLPLRLESESEERVDAKATFVRRYALRPQARGEKQFIERSLTFPQVVDATVVPDDVDLEWDEIPAGARVSIGLKTFDGARWTEAWETSMALAGGRGLAEVDFAPEPMTRYRYRCELLDANGGAIAADGPGRVAIVFRFVDRPIPTMTYGLDEVAYDIRMLHPMAYERCEIESLSARAISQGAWRELTVYLGEPGQHLRHLVHAED